MKQDLNVIHNQARLTAPSLKFRSGFKAVLLGTIFAAVLFFTGVVFVADIFIKILLLVCTLVISWCAFNISQNKHKFCTLIFDKNSKQITSPLDNQKGNLFPVLSLESINGLCICHSKASGSAHGGGGNSWELGIVDAQDVIFGTSFVENNEEAAMDLLIKLCYELNVPNLGLIETDFPYETEIDGQKTYIMERL